jgi:hypothetical protein
VCKAFYHTSIVEAKINAYCMSEESCQCFSPSGILLPRWTIPEIFGRVFFSADRRIDLSYKTRNRMSRLRYQIRRPSMHLKIL